MTHGYHQSIMDFIVSEEQGSSLSPVKQGHQLVKRWRNSADMAKAAMAVAQEAQERHSNIRHLVGDEFRLGDRMWLKLKHVKTTQPIKKLDWIVLLYRVLACIGTHAVQLDTPPGIHLVFHMSLVKKVVEDPLPSQLTIDNDLGMIFDTAEDPSSVAINSDGEYMIERILRHRHQGHGWRLLVKWFGCQSQLGNHCNNSKRRRHWMHMSVYYMMLDLSYLGTALLLFIRDHKEGREGDNSNGQRPYSIARPYTRL